MRKKVLSALRKIKGGKRDELSPICPNVYNLLDKEQVWPISVILSELFRRWSHFSGSARFPVPSPSAALSAQDFYIREYHAQVLWKNKKRLELLDFMIEELAKDVA